MVALMVDSDQLSVLLAPEFSNMRVATYADIVTTEFIASTQGRLVVIDRGLGDPHGVATVADVEHGALTVAQGIDRMRLWHSQSRPYPTVYHNRADWAAVNEQGKGIPFTHWVSALDGTLLPDGYRMSVVQFAGSLQLGIHADMSIVWNDDWHPVPPAVPGVPVSALKQLAADAQTALAHLTSAIGKL